jgi:hypothetical protein
MMYRLSGLLCDATSLAVNVLDIVDVGLRPASTEYTGEMMEEQRREREERKGQTT